MSPVRSAALLAFVLGRCCMKAISSSRVDSFGHHHLELGAGGSGKQTGSAGSGKQIQSSQQDWGTRSGSFFLFRPLSESARETAPSGRGALSQRIPYAARRFFRKCIRRHRRNGHGLSRYHNCARSGERGRRKVGVTLRPASLAVHCRVSPKGKVVTLLAHHSYISIYLTFAE